MPLIPLLGQLIASGGLPVIARVVGGVLSKKEGPLQEAGKLLMANSAEVSKLSGRDNAKIALAELSNEAAEHEGNIELLIEQQKTQRSELASSSWLARSWRPIFGLLIGFTWAIQMIGITFLVFFMPERAPAVIAALGALTVQWSMGFAAIGVNIHSRSKDKRQQLQADTGVAPTGLLQTLVEKLNAK